VTALGIGFAVILGAWFTLSIVVHLHSETRARLPFLETWGVLPHWNFFAPRPGVHDTHLLFRDIDRNGEPMQLGYVPMIGPRRWYHFLWHPDKFRSKVVADIAAAIQVNCRLTQESDGDSRLVMLTQPYVLALHLAMRMPHPPAACARQFILARNRTFDEEVEQHLVYISEYHPFAASDDDSGA